MGIPKKKPLPRQKSLGFGFGKKVLVSVSENLVLEKSFGLRKFGLGQKVSVLVLENLVSEKKNQNNKKESKPKKQCKSLI